jgi:hypothetical protein
MNKRGTPKFLSKFVKLFKKKEPVSEALRKIATLDKRERMKLLARTEFHQFSFDTLLSVTVFQTFLTYTIERNLPLVGRI